MFEIIVEVLMALSSPIYIIGYSTQIIKLRKVKDSTGFSCVTMFFYNVGSIIWVLYSIKTGDLIYIVVNIINMILDLYTLYLVLKYRKGKVKCVK